MQSPGTAWAGPRTCAPRFPRYLRRRNETSFIGRLTTLSYLLAHEKYGVEVALVVSRSGASTYNGQIVAGASTGINTLADLKGKKFCFVDPNSTSGSVIPRILLKANGINPDTD